jgi:seryl-tRNA synthetase
MLRLVHKGGGPAGRGFVTWRGSGARLIRALVNFMLDVHTRECGYEEVRAPAVASRAALTGSAHLPLLEDKMYAVAERAREPAAEPAAPGGMPTPPLREGKMYAVGAPTAPAHGPAVPAPEPAAEAAGHSQTSQDLFLAPRAEPHLANLYAGEILDAARLPIRLACAGPAFRREAGGGRGLLRLHQFDTVELYVFASAEQEEEELARAVRAAETIPERLQVPHRRSLRPAPRLSHAAAKTIDLEVWAPGIKEWLAVAAISTFTDYQARRTNTRYRDAGGRTRFVYTIGGAAVALPHLVAALLENGQEADGSVRLPAALGPYFGAAEIHG